MTIYNPYTYLIGWTHLDKWYYGVRYAKGCHPSDFWDTYFTSSKYVQDLRESEGEPDVIQIRRVFDCPDKARMWEHKVLKRTNAVYEDRYINKSHANLYNTFTSEQTSETTKKAMSDPNLRKHLSKRAKERGMGRRSCILCKRTFDQGNFDRHYQTHFGRKRMWIRNDKECTMIWNDEPIPEGWWKGKIQPKGYNRGPMPEGWAESHSKKIKGKPKLVEHRKAMSKTAMGRKAITNGKRNTWLHQGQKMPQGFRYVSSKYT